MNKWTVDYSAPEHAAIRQEAAETVLYDVLTLQNNGGNSHIVAARTDPTPAKIKRAALQLAALTISYLRRQERL